MKKLFIGLVGVMVILSACSSNDHTGDTAKDSVHVSADTISHVDSTELDSSTKKVVKKTEEQKEMDVMKDIVKKRKNLK